MIAPCLALTYIQVTCGGGVRDGGVVGCVTILKMQVTSKWRWKIDVDAGRHQSTPGHDFQKSEKLFEERKGAGSKTVGKLRINLKTLTVEISGNNPAMYPKLLSSRSTTLL